MQSTGETISASPRRSRTRSVVSLRSSASGATSITASHRSTPGGVDEDVAAGCRRGIGAIATGAATQRHQPGHDHDERACTKRRRVHGDTIQLLEV